MSSPALRKRRILSMPRGAGARPKVAIDVCDQLLRAETAKRSAPGRYHQEKLAMGRLEARVTIAAPSNE
jgi:hypothetical protein